MPLHNKKQEQKNQQSTKRYNGIGATVVGRIDISITRQDIKAIQRLQERANFGLLMPAKAMETVTPLCTSAPISIRVE